MDSKKAFDILDLAPDVSFEDARQAYRNLAKKYHPDVAGEDITAQKKAEAWMKEINLAFLSISAELKSKSQSDDPKPSTPPAGQTKKPQAQAEQETKTDSFSWQQMLDDVLSIFKQSKISKPQASSTTSRKLGLKNKARVREKTLKFDQILKTVYPEGDLVENKKSKGGGQYRSQTSNSYDGYQKYMALKKKIRAMQPRRNKDMSVGRVEKISPVKPVSPIKK